MKIIKKTYFSILGCVENLVRLVENHEALSQVALEELRTAIARVQARKAKLDQEADRLGQKIKEQERAIQNWEERARSVEQQDREKALECLKIKLLKERENRKYQEQHQLYLESAAKLRVDLIKLNEQHAEYSARRNLMLARTAQAEASGIAAELQSSDYVGVEQIFNDWEVKVAGFEPLAESHPTAYSLEKEFAAVEEQKLLEAELNKLRNA